MATGDTIKILTHSDIADKAEKTSVESLQLSAHEHANKETIDAINKAFTTALKAVYDNAAQLDETGTLMSAQIPSSLIAGLEWAGSLNVLTGTLPVPSESNNGNFYKIKVGGTSSITGESTVFKAGDWVISNSVEWEHVPNNLDNATEETVGLVKLAGDIAGTFDNIKITGIRNIEIEDAIPADKQTLVFDATTNTFRFMDFSTSAVPDTPTGLSITYNKVDWTSAGLLPSDYEFSVDGGNSWNNAVSKPIISDNYTSDPVDPNNFYLRVKENGNTPASLSLTNTTILYPTEEWGRVIEMLATATKRYGGSSTAGYLTNVPDEEYFIIKNTINPSDMNGCVCYRDYNGINFRGTYSRNGGWIPFDNSLITWAAGVTGPPSFDKSLVPNMLASKNDFPLADMDATWGGSAEAGNGYIYIIHQSNHDTIVNDDGKIACYPGDGESAWW